MKKCHVLLLSLLPFLFAGSSCAQGKGEPGSQKRTRDTEVAGWLGTAVQDMTPKLARSMNVKTEEGALINEVVEESPAEKAGLQEEDVVVEFAGKKIVDADDLVSAVRKSAPESSSAIVVMRKDEKKSFQVTLGRRPRSNDRRSFSLRVPTPPRIRIFRDSELYGLILMELNRQLGEYFDAPGGHGVLVEEVERRSKAEKAGFKAGDVIVTIGKERVEEIRDIHNALEDYKEGDKADVEVVRKGTKVKLALEVEEPTRDRMYRFRSDFGPGEFNFHGFDNEQFRTQMQKLNEELRSLGKKLHVGIFEPKTL